MDFQHTQYTLLSKKSFSFDTNIDLVLIDGYEFVEESHNFISEIRNCWFQRNGSPTHNAAIVYNYLSTQFPERLINRRSTQS